MPMEWAEEFPTTEENGFNKISSQKTSVAPLMAAIKGLLDLTNDYLQNLKKDHPVLHDLKSHGKKQRLKASLPRRQSKEDRRVMIRLGSNHEARKSGSFELRQKVQSILPDKSLLSDAFFVLSGYKDTTEKMFGEATVERQETWKTFVIGPIPKTIRNLDCIHNTMEGLLQEELAFVRDMVPILYMGWTRRTQNEEPYGYTRICVPESRADEFLFRLQIFGEAVSVQRICQRNQITVCEKCFGFHATRVCARSKKCETCGADAHNGTCQSGPRCLNCRVLHGSNNFSYPARPRRFNGILKRPTGAQLHHIRTIGGREHAKVNSQKAINPTIDKTSTTETEIFHSSQ
ncbi:hypothetical protein EPUL_004623 [Erysiphe pulchra]|uniref:Uncharacterized protein n=1 Tax=Erysiphe pulchra TaxID=225359 RepID=A0A2S4PJI2_9PEZI|nr:hypothetical protein EPUL_004623 [Erysiphe pulchra]